MWNTGLGFSLTGFLTCWFVLLCFLFSTGSDQIVDLQLNNNLKTIYLTYSFKRFLLLQTLWFLNLKTDWFNKLCLFKPHVLIRFVTVEIGSVFRHWFGNWVYIARHWLWFLVWNLESIIDSPDWYQLIDIGTIIYIYIYDIDCTHELCKYLMFQRYRIVVYIWNNRNKRLYVYII